MLSALLNIAVLAFSVSGMLSVGLSYKMRQLIAPLGHVREVIRALVINFVLVPLLAYAVAQVLSLDQSLEIGLMLVASAAGAALLVKLVQIAGSDVALGATLLVLLLPVTVVFMSIVVPLIEPEAQVNAGAIAKPLVLSMLLPLGIGLFIKTKFPHWATRFQPIMGKAANIALALLLVTTVLANFRLVLDMFGTGAILASFLVIGGALVIGYALGGSDRNTRVLLGFGSAQRNYAAAMVVAVESFDDPRVFVMVAVMSTISMLLVPAARMLGKRAAKGEAAEGSRPHGEAT